MITSERFITISVVITGIILFLEQFGFIVDDLFNKKQYELIIEIILITFYFIQYFKLFGKIKNTAFFKLFLVS